MERRADSTDNRLRTPPQVRRSIWHRPLGANVLPLAGSVAIHGAIILLGIVTFKAVEVWVQPRQEQLIIPEAAIIERADLGIPQPALGEDPSHMAAQDHLIDSAPPDQRWAARPSQSLSRNLLNLGEEPMAAGTTIGIGPAAAGARGRSEGADADISGSPAPFGVPGVAGSAMPASDFMGISGNARNVIYVCDATGTMMGEMWALRRELRKSIEALRPIQGFNIIFFRDERVVSFDRRGPVLATAQNKRRALEFVDGVDAYGNTWSVLPALELALRQKPDLIYFLTDGDLDPPLGPGAQVVIDSMRKLNEGGSIRINTIGFNFLDAWDEAEHQRVERVLKTIAQESGGIYKYISRGSLP